MKKRHEDTDLKSGAGHSLFRGGWAALLLVLACIAWPSTDSARGQSRVFSPENVKAAFLYHFGAYVTWPRDTQSASTLTIAILQAPEITNELQRITAGRMVQNREVQVRAISDIDELDNAQILFIGERANRSLPRMLARLEGRPVLVVTDAPDGLRQGAMINFIEANRRVRFEVSLPAARRSELELSSRLLAVALRVERGDENL